MQQQKRKPKPTQQQPEITQQQQAITDESPPIDSKQKRYSLPADLQATLPMTHATKAWCKAAIKRQMQNGVFELDKIITNTGISSELATELYIEIT